MTRTDFEKPPGFDYLQKFVKRWENIIVLDKHFEFIKRILRRSKVGKVKKKTKIYIIINF